MFAVQHSSVSVRRGRAFLGWRPTDLLDFAGIHGPPSLVVSFPLQNLGNRIRLNYAYDLDVIFSLTNQVFDKRRGGQTPVWDVVNET